MVDFSSNKNSKRSTLTSSKTLVTSCCNGSVDAYIRLKSFSMLEVLSVLHSFSLLAIHECVDIYSTFRLKALHCHSLGLFRTLNERFYNYLSEPQRTLTAQKYQSGSFEPFSAIKRIVFTYLNSFLKRTDKNSVGSGLKLDYSKRHCSRRLSGLFSRSSTIGV